MKFKSIFNWVAGIMFANLGVALCTKANFGLSMIGATPYIIHKWLVGSYSWFSQGTAEYVWEAILLIIGCIVIRQFKPKYLLSFLTAVIVGFVMDGWFILLGGNGAYESFVARIIAFILGTLLTSIGVAFFFHSTMPMQVYELVVKEFSERYNKDLNKVKYVFDISLLLLALILSFVLTKGLTGIGVGTIIITLVNAPLIGFFRKLIEKLEADTK